jgi:hypothetical protein
MAKIPKWFKSYLETNKQNFNLIILIALVTGFTSFGLPQPPKVIQDFLDDYKWFKWIMLWLLIYQGGSGQNLMVTNIAFGILFTIYNLDWNYIIKFIKENKKYLVLISPFIYYFVY